jgi:O-antigen/teichoic acid export membrane protein
MALKRPSNLVNSGWNVLNILLYPTIFLGLTPLFMDHLGEGGFGEWTLYSSYVFLSVQLLSFGLTNSLTVHVAESLGSHDVERLRGYLNSGARLIAQISAVTLALSVLPLVFLTCGEVCWLSPSILFSVSGATVLIAAKFPELYAQSVLRGYERYDEAAIFNIASRVGALIVQAILIVCGFSLAVVLLVTALITALLAVWQLRVITEKLHGYRINIAQVSTERSDLLRFGFWSWVQTVIAVVAFQIDRFIVAAFLGTASLAYYALASTIANHLHLAFEGAVSFLLPKIARLRGEQADGRGHFFSIRAFSIGTSIFVLTCLALFGDPLFTLWLGEERALKLMPLMRLFLLFELFLILSIVPKMYLNALRHFRLITGLELLYKLGLILGMAIGFWAVGTAESLIIGQIVALLILLPVVFATIDRFVLRRGAIREALQPIVPCVFASLAILAPNGALSLVWGVCGAAAFWISYVRDGAFKFDLIIE